MENILVPYHSSSLSKLAFQQALTIASKWKLKLILLSVIGPDIGTSGMSASNTKKLLDKHDEKAKNLLNKFKDVCEEKNVKLEISTIRDPSAASGIIRFANENDVDLIIIGSHGRSGLKRIILGSVAAKVIKDSNCPVMIIKNKKHIKK
ncbi:MAG: universal stress protein [Nitrosarchaeum sp.]